MTITEAAPMTAIMDDLDGNPIRIELIQMTPSRARYWLDRNMEDQRALRPTKVERYARDMAGGHWPITGDTVKISPDDELLDGQHRLAAVIEAGVTVAMLVAYGVEKSVVPVLDTGASRTFADVLHMHGLGGGQRNITASVVRRVVQWERGNYMAQGGALAPTHTEMLERYEQDPGLFIAAGHRGNDASKHGLGHGSASGTAFFLFRRIDDQAAQNFFDGYIGGENLSTGNPILVLRNRMIRSRTDERLRPAEVLALFVRTWNAHRKDKPLYKVPVVRSGKLSNQNFPLPE